MIQKFDFFHQHDSPNIWLCNPNKHRILYIKDATDSSVILRFNEMSELKFKVASFEDCFKYMESKRLIELEDVGYFIINDVQDVNNGIEQYKEVTAYSLEAELQYKKITLFDGTYKFYDIVEPFNTLIGQIFDGSNGWSIDYVDPDLENKYRTFEIPDSTIYLFLMNDVETAYECIFVFNSWDRTVLAYYLPNYLKKTDIYLTFQNIIKETKVEEKSDEIVTSLKVYGSNINIRGVNPTGLDAIYDFSYFKNKQWMLEHLITILNLWENKVEASKDRYKELLLDKKNRNNELISFDIELSLLQEEYDSLEGVMSVRVKAGQDISDIKKQMDDKQKEIDKQKQLIQDSKSVIDSISKEIQVILKNLAIENNITGKDWEELLPYVIQNTYQNELFLKTSIMSEAQIQEQQEQLLEMGYNVLSRVSHPRYVFSLDTVNFLYLEKFKKFTDQLELGCIINIQNSDQLIRPILLSVEYLLDDPTVLNLTFGNRYKLDSAEYEFSELFGDAISGGTSVKFDSAKWGEYVNSGMNDEVSTFIGSALDASKNNVINAKNQNIIINQNGLRGRTQNPDGSYDKEQCWLTADTLAFTKDNWNTASLALGKVKIPDSDSYVYGLVGEAVVGKLLAGNQLIISNENNNFLLDSNGAVLNNASFTIVSGNNTIKLDPTDGISVLKNAGTLNEEKQLYLDPNTGDLKVAGTLEATTGYIGGWKIDKDGLLDLSGNYIKSDGTGKLGLMRWDETSANFDGNIYAKNLNGNYDEWDLLKTKLASVDTLIAEKASVGDLNAINANIANLDANKANVSDLIISGQKATGQSVKPLTGLRFNNSDAFLRDIKLNVKKNALGYVTDVSFDLEGSPKGVVRYVSGYSQGLVNYLGLSPTSSFVN